MSSFPLDVLVDPDESALERLLAGWLGPARPSEVSAPSISIPFALREGLLTISGWPDLFRQNAVQRPSEIEVVRGLGRFLDENQAVCAWAFRLTDADQTDPPVWMDDGAAGGPWKVDDRVSRFLVKMAIEELILGGDGPFMSTEAGQPVADVLADLSRLDSLGPLAWPYDGSSATWFYAGSAAIGMASLDQDGEVEFAWRGERGSR